MYDDLVLTKLLRQDRAIVIAGAAAIALLGWTYLFYQGWAMQHMDLVAMAMPSTGAWGPMDLLLVFAMWAVMMVAMMVPRLPPCCWPLLRSAAAGPHREGRSFPCGCSSRAIWYCGRLSASPPRWHSGDCTA